MTEGYQYQEPDTDALLRKIFDGLDALNKEAKPKIKPEGNLYHYTDLPGAFGILRSDRLWFTECSHMNDPVEVQYGLKIGIEAVERHCGEDPRVRRVLEVMRERQANRFPEMAFYIASFSLDGESLPQWRSYADDGRGVALGFDASFEPEIPIASGLRAAFPIQYSKSKLVATMRGVTAQALDTLSILSGMTPDSEARLLSEVATKLLTTMLRWAVQFKHSAYEFEQEYRCPTSALMRHIAGLEKRRVLVSS